MVSLQVHFFTSIHVCRSTDDSIVVLNFCVVFIHPQIVKHKPKIVVKTLEHVKHSAHPVLRAPHLPPWFGPLISCCEVRAGKEEGERVLSLYVTWKILPLALVLHKH